MMYSVPPCYQYGGSPRFARRSCHIVQIKTAGLHSRIRSVFPPAPSLKPCLEGGIGDRFQYFLSAERSDRAYRPRGVPPGIDPADPRIKQGGQVPPNDPRRLMTLLAAIPAGPAAQERHFTVRRNNRPMIGNRPKVLNANLIGSLTIVTSRSNIFVAADHRLYDCSS